MSPSPEPGFHPPRFCAGNVTFQNHFSSSPNSIFSYSLSQDSGVFQDAVIFKREKKQPSASSGRDLWKQVLLKKNETLAALWPDRALHISKTQCLLSFPQLIRGPVWQWMALTINTSWKISNRVRGNGKKMRCSYRETISDVSCLTGCVFFSQSGWGMRCSIQDLHQLTCKMYDTIICIKFDSIDIALRCCYEKVVGSGTRCQSTQKLPPITL